MQNRANSVAQIEENVLITLPSDSPKEANKKSEWKTGIARLSTDNVSKMAD